MLRLLELSAIVITYVVVFCLSDGFPILLDFLLLITYACTWCFGKETKPSAMARSVYFAIVFVYVIGAGMNPTEKQLQDLAQYEMYNQRFDELIGSGKEGRASYSYFGIMRLIAECKFNGFKMYPPTPIPLKVKQ